MRDQPRADAIGLVLHPTRAVRTSIETIVAAADSNGLRVLAREVDRHRVPETVDLEPDSDFVEAVDGVIALGGDGTMLGAMRLMIDRPVPVLGFLVEVSPAELPAALGAARHRTLHH